MAHLLWMTKIRDFPVGNGRTIFNIMEAIGNGVSLAMLPDTDSVVPKLVITGVGASLVLDEAGPKTLTYLLHRMQDATDIVAGWLDDDEGTDCWDEFAGDPKMN
jgi:hypothetical protein